MNQRSLLSERNTRGALRRGTRSAAQAVPMATPV
jgi:hypothetical protein